MGAVVRHPGNRKGGRFKELENEALLVYYSKMFKGSNVDIRAITAILIAGLQYLYVHKDKSTFCGLDLNDKTDKARLNKLIRQIVENLFANVQSDYVDSKTVGLAKRMAEKGIDAKTISDVLEICEKDVKAILQGE